MREEIDVVQAIELYRLCSNWREVAKQMPRKTGMKFAHDAVQKKVRQHDRKAWEDLKPQQQAGMRSSEQRFAVFLQESHAGEWAEAPNTADCIRLICGVASRKELAIDHRARVLWHQLDEEFRAWLIT